MEAKGDIDQGSMAKLRREAKAASTHTLKAVQMLANALSPVVNLDAFLPRSGGPADVVDLNALTRKPTLIVCADEERKQFLEPMLCYHCHIFQTLLLKYSAIKSVKCVNRFCDFEPPRVKWINQLAYSLGLRMWRKQDYHHRSVNDAKLSIQHCGLWGRVGGKQSMQF